MSLKPTALYRKPGVRSTLPLRLSPSSRAPLPHPAVRYASPPLAFTASIAHLFAYEK